jgi:hypothetical protein
VDDDARIRVYTGPGFRLMACLKAENQLGEPAPDAVFLDVLILDSMVFDDVVKVAAFAELQQEHAVSVFSSPNRFSPSPSRSLALTSMQTQYVSLSQHAFLMTWTMLG